MLTRNESLSRLAAETWDVVVIGGGASGLGAAVDAASRGCRTVLLEQWDFAKGTTSRSTKLIHGGVRYLRQGNVSLVRESLHERGLLLRHAPGIVHPLKFIIPTSSWMESLYYATGMKAYDFLAGSAQIAPSRMLSWAEVSRQAPGLSSAQVRGGVSYFDAQFDDARLALALAEQIYQLNGLALNYFPVMSLLKRQGSVHGVVARDAESGQEIEIPAKAVVNAAGAFSDEIRRMDEPGAGAAVKLSQGIHLVLPRSFYPGDVAIIVPSTDDGRVLFVIPWHEAVLVGTTDTPVDEALLEPRPQPGEIDYLLDHVSRYLAQTPTRRDVRSCFAGLRPLARPSDARDTSKISRDHHVGVSASGLVSITGGKWTTYRKMGQDTIDAALQAARIQAGPSQTSSMTLAAGANALPWSLADGVTDDAVRQMVRQEMARQVEDVLARRTRLLFLDAQAALNAAPRVAQIMAEELGRDDVWVQSQIAAFELLAGQYQIASQS